jgi:hypothetical protein
LLSVNTVPATSIYVFALAALALCRGAIFSQKNLKQTKEEPPVQ